MKILTICTSFPYPPDDGTKIQTFERLRSLSARHEVTLLCVSPDHVQAERIAEMERYCRCVCLLSSPVSSPRSLAGKLFQMGRSFRHQEPYYIHDAVSPQAAAWVQGHCAAGKYDVVEADGYANAYLRQALDAYKVGIFHSVADSCAKREAALAPGKIRRATVRIFNTLTKRYEASVVRELDLCVTLTEDNRRDLQKLYPSAVVRNRLSNGIDMEYFSYEAPRTSPIGACFLGKMDYSPNQDAVLWFCREVLPVIRLSIPDFRFQIVGSAPSREVKALADDPGVSVTGYVEDVRPYVRECGIMVLPMRMGGGILNKMLQSFAMGAPVVATSLSLEGLSAQPDLDLLVADTSEGLASKLTQLALDGPLRQRLARSARQYVETSHQWSAVVGRYEAELMRQIGVRRSTGQAVAPALSAV